MSLRFGLLGLLSTRPMSGYELARTFDEALSAVWSAGHSQIYPELARLEESGLIRVAETGPRGRKVYAVTAQGGREFRDWLLHTEPDRAIRNEPLLRTMFLSLVKPNEATEYLDEELQREREVLTQLSGAAPDESIAPLSELALEWSRRYATAVSDWLQWERRQVRRR